MHFVWLEAFILLVNNLINIFKVNPNIIEYCAFAVMIVSYNVFVGLLPTAKYIFSNYQYELKELNKYQTHNHILNNNIYLDWNFN